MTIDEKYGHPTSSEEVYAPVSAFPKALHDRLVEALSELAGLWSGMEIDAYRTDGVVHLRVTLDVGDRPLHLYLDEDGDTLLFDAPILFDFPREASYFVLKDLCGDISCLTLCVTERFVRKGGGDEGQKPSLRQTDVLYGYGFFGFEEFISSASELLPIFVSTLTEAEKELRAFLEVWPPVDGLIA